METTYRLVARLLHRLPLVAGKLARTLAGRRQAADRWCAWAARARGGGPLVWLHAASVGEALAAEPVVRRLRVALPGVSIVLSHTSPSVVGWVGPAGADHADFLPLDEPAPIGRMLDAMRPDLLVLSRGDLWPELLHQTHARGVPVAVTGAAIARRSRRLAWPARTVLRAACEHLHYVGAVTQADAERWHRLGVPRDRIDVTGDPRYDRVVERPVDLRALGPLRPWCGAWTVVAGSIEREDEAVVLGAAAGTLRDPGVRWLLVPHEPTARAVRRLIARARARGLAVGVWAGEGAAPRNSPVLVVATRGLLADLWVLADAAYVGGAFRSGRLHAVAEPAVYGVPVAFGPHGGEAADAVALLAAGGGTAVAGASELLALFDRWRAMPRERAAAGLCARGVLVEGAAGRSVGALLKLLA